MLAALEAHQRSFLQDALPGSAALRGGLNADKKVEKSVWEMDDSEHDDNSEGDSSEDEGAPSFFLRSFPSVTPRPNGALTRPLRVKRTVILSLRLRPSPVRSSSRSRSPAAPQPQAPSATCRPLWFVTTFVLSEMSH